MQNRLKLINFYSHVNYSVTKIVTPIILATSFFYSHVNYSVTKILACEDFFCDFFYSHVNYSVTKIYPISYSNWAAFTVT